MPSFSANLKKTLLVVTVGEVEDSKKIASFDMDFTFIKPKNYRKFPINSDDWEWWEPSAPENLKKLHAAGFKIVVFTNQGGVKAGKTTVLELQSKFKKI